MRARSLGAAVGRFLAHQEQRENPEGISAPTGVAFASMILLQAERPG